MVVERVPVRDRQASRTMKGLEEVDEVEIFEAELPVLDWRDLRRKGMDGGRKVGKTEGTE